MAETDILDFSGQRGKQIQELEFSTIVDNYSKRLEKNSVFRDFLEKSLESQTVLS